MGKSDHPVWTVYDRLRTARLNVKYYGSRLASTERLNFTLEMVLAASAPTSAVAGLWFWSTDLGKLLWQWLGVAAALAAIAKPLLGLTKRIKDYENLLSGYRSLDYDLMEIKSLIEQKRKYDASLQGDFKRALAKERVLVGKNPESRECRRVKETCEKAVIIELPAESFYVPED